MTIRLGSWTFDRRDDEIADISFAGVTLLRSIRAVVRDRNWATAELTITDTQSDGSSLTLFVSCTDLGADIRGTVQIETSHDSLTVTFDAQSQSDYLSNRVGLVVLHPHRLAGSPLRVTHSDGSRADSVYPLAVSPHQPVIDIAALAWQDSGLAVQVDFVGDVFEMEDQRNWSDASYKTYSRPLALPFPYPIGAGERIRQQVTVRAVGAPSDAAAAATPTITLHAAGTFPQIVLGAATAPDPAPAHLPAFVSAAPVALVELDLDSPNWRAALQRAASPNSALDVRLIVPAADDAQWGTTTPGGITGDALVDALSEVATALAPHRIARIGAFDPISHTTEPGATAALRAALADAGVADADVAPEVLEGARSHFTELNREQRRIVTDADAVTFASTPLFHSLGDEQLFESIAVQRVLAEQSLAISGGRPVHIGPITMRPRFNNVATVRQPMPTADTLIDGYGAQFTGAADPRQSTDEAAAWLVASAAAFAVPGVASLSYFEQWGPRGVVADDGTPSPAGAVLATLTGLSGELLSGDSPDGLIWAIGCRSEQGSTVLLANLDTVERTVSLELDGARPDGAAHASSARIHTVPARAHLVLTCWPAETG